MLSSDTDFKPKSWSSGQDGRSPFKAGGRGGDEKWADVTLTWGS